MTGAPPQETPIPGLVFKMYRAVVGVGLVCGLAIVTVFEVTRPIIARNKIEARQRAILHVLPGATESLSSGKTIRQLASLMVCSSPEPVAPVGRTRSAPSPSRDSTAR